MGFLSVIATPFLYALSTGSSPETYYTVTRAQKALPSSPRQLLTAIAPRQPSGAERLVKCLDSCPSRCFVTEVRSPAQRYVMSERREKNKNSSKGGMDNHSFSPSQYLPSSIIRQWEENGKKIITRPRV